MRPTRYVDQSYRDEQDGEVGVVGYEINFKPLFLRVSSRRATCT